MTGLNGSTQQITGKFMCFINSFILIHYSACLQFRHYTQCQEHTISSDRHDPILGLKTFNPSEGILTFSSDGIKKEKAFWEL